MTSTTIEYYLHSLGLFDLDQELFYINSSVKNLFTEHPRSVGESYLLHMFNALRFALTFLILFFIALVHAILPFLFVRTVSDIVCEMSKDMECRKKI